MPNWCKVWPTPHHTWWAFLFFFVSMVNFSTGTCSSVSKCWTTRSITSRQSSRRWFYSSSKSEPMKSSWICADCRSLHRSTSCFFTCLHLLLCLVMVDETQCVQNVYDVDLNTDAFLLTDNPVGPGTSQYKVLLYLPPFGRKFRCQIMPLPIWPPFGGSCGLSWSKIAVYQSTP